MKKRMTKAEALERTLKVNGLTFADVYRMNEFELKAIEVDCFNRYGVSINFCVWSNGISI